MFSSFLTNLYNLVFPDQTLYTEFYVQLKQVVLVQTRLVWQQGAQDALGRADKLTKIDALNTLFKLWDAFRLQKHEEENEALPNNLLISQAHFVLSIFHRWKQTLI